MGRRRRPGDRASRTGVAGRRRRPFRLVALAAVVVGPALSACSMGGNAPVQAPADLVVVDADVHTVDASMPLAAAIAVRNGRFVAVGEAAEALVGPDTEVIDAGGATVVPGLIDGHVHFGSGSSLIRGVDLTGIASRGEWLRIIAAKAEALPDGAWIVGGRWDHTLDGGGFPTKEDLDAVTPRNPVVLSDIDGHTAWANSLALEIAGINADTPDPQGGRILRDENGEATGIFLESGGLVSRHVPDLTEEERVAARRDTLRYANSLGITMAHDMAGAGALDDYLALLREDELTVRIWFGTYTDLDSVDDVVALRDRIRREVELIERSRAAAGVDTKALARDEGGARGPLLQVGYIKLLIDGVLSSRTAAMLEPYADAPAETGLPRMSQQQLDDLVAAGNAAGFPVAIHAIGDRGVRMSLDAFEASQATHRPPLPNRIEHNEVVDPADATRYAELGVIASMNPHHCITGIDKYNTARLGPERAAWSFPWGRLRDAGATLVFGSDWATAPLAPIEHLYAATLREKPSGGPSGGWYPENRLSWDEALRAYTLSAAEITGHGDELGSIEVGKWADFVIFDRPLPEPL
ncbi:MAG: amidohydrolase, partial [Acidobacteriota bacterium]